MLELPVWGPHGDYPPKVGAPDEYLPNSHLLVYHTRAFPIP